MSDVDILILEKKKPKYEWGGALLVVLSLVSLILTIGATMELESYQILQELCYEGEEKKYYDPANDRCDDHQRYYSDGEDLSLEELRSLQDQYRRAQYIFGFLSIAGFLGAAFCIIKAQTLGGQMEKEISEQKLIRSQRISERRAERNKKIDEERQYKEKQEIKRKVKALLDKGGLEDLRKARDITSRYNYNTTKIEIEIANKKEELLDYRGAILDFERLGLHTDAKRIRQKIQKEKEIKLEQTVVQGDQITKTEIKDSVINRSKIGSGEKSKAEEIKELKELHDTGAIDDDEFKQMKKEILGK